MRLIDGDELYEVLEGGFDIDFDELPETKAALLEMIARQPTVEPEIATDCISRQAAIDEIGEKADEIYKTKQNGATYPHDDFFQGMAYAEDVVRQLPSAEPVRKGKWLRYGEDGYPNEEDTVFWQCDQCLEQYTGRTTRIPNFCPNCGADMRYSDD